MDGKLIAGAALTASLELVGHWAPWPKSLHRLAQYGYGVAAILAGLAVATERKTWHQTAIISVAAGFATITAYLVDHHLHARQVRRAHEGYHS